MAHTDWVITSHLSPRCSTLGPWGAEEEQEEEQEPCDGGATHVKTALPANHPMGSSLAAVKTKAIGLMCPVAGVALARTELRARARSTRCPSLVICANLR